MLGILAAAAFAVAAFAQAPAAAQPQPAPSIQAPPTNAPAPEAPNAVPPAPSTIATATLPHDLSPWGMFLSADIVVKAVMVGLVFASFVTNASPTIKLIGFGMAIAVLIDSTIVRMVLVPAAMELFGKAAWWFPKWLHWLPHLNIEGPSTDLPADPPLVAAETTPGDNAP